MEVSAQGFWLPKRGSSDAEYEDALEPPALEPRQCGRARFAVADGATETSWSGVWARILVRAWGEETLGDGSFLPDLAELRRQWLATVHEKPVPWYAEEKIDQGAFAAFAGLTFEEAPETAAGRRWSSLALGDSCIFLMRDEQLVETTPIGASEEFSSRPWLISSRDRYDTGLEARLSRREGQWEPEDVFHLMTDAMAAWFLYQAEQGAKPWTLLEGFKSSEQSAEFAEFIDWMRTEGRIKNDDVTWLSVRVR